MLHLDMHNVVLVYMNMQMFWFNFVFLYFSIYNKFFLSLLPDYDNEYIAWAKEINLSIQYIQNCQRDNWIRCKPQHLQVQVHI